MRNRLQGIASTQRKTIHKIFGLLLHCWTGDHFAPIRSIDIE
jgi:hypothetical protein